MDRQSIAHVLECCAETRVKFARVFATGLLVAGLATTWGGILATEPDELKARRFQFTQLEMAVPVRLVFYCADATTATGAAEAAFKRIGRLNSILSDYDPQSELRRFERATLEGNAVPVGDDLWEVLNYAEVISRRSEGAFDVTVGPIVRLWRRARRKRQLPSPERLKAARELVGYRLVQLNDEDQTVRLLKPGMRLDMGGIAKGYAADEALGVLKKFGINRALIDAGGDIVLGVPPPDEPGWRVGIARLEADGPPSRVLLLSNCAVATSGDTWQFVEIDGRRYSHIVDPRTGRALADHSNVTVVAPNGIAADSLASAVSVLGPAQGLRLIEATPGCAALIVRAPDGKVELQESSGWKKLRTEK